MTIADVHADPALLAEYLGIEPEDITHANGKYHRYRRHYPEQRPETHDEFVDRVRLAWLEYTLATRPKTQQTWGQMIHEALIAKFGMRRGSVKERRRKLLERCPDVYTPLEILSER